MTAAAPRAGTGSSETRAPLPDATTHGAHSAAAPVDEPPTTTGAIRTRAAHVASAPATAQVPEATEQPDPTAAVDAPADATDADAADASRASRPADDHPHGRHAAE